MESNNLQQAMALPEIKALIEALKPFAGESERLSSWGVDDDCIVMICVML